MRRITKLYGLAIELAEIILRAMKLKITRNTLVKGVHAEAGSIVEVGPDTARQLIEARKAEPAPEGKKPAPTKAAKIETRDPKPSRRR